MGSVFKIPPFDLRLCRRAVVGTCGGHKHGLVPARSIDAASVVVGVLEPKVGSVEHGWRWFHLVCHLGYIPAATKLARLHRGIV